MLADQYKTEDNQFERLGHPGRITEVYTFSGGQVDFTGSMYGYGAIRVVNPGATGNSNFVQLSGGGSVLLDDIDASGLGIVPVSVAQISGSTVGASSGTTKVYVFKVRGTI